MYLAKVAGKAQLQLKRYVNVYVLIAPPYLQPYESQLMGSWWRVGAKDGDGWRCFSKCCKFHISRKMLKIYAAAFAVIVSSLLTSHMFINCSIN